MEVDRPQTTDHRRLSITQLVFDYKNQEELPWSVDHRLSSKFCLSDRRMKGSACKAFAGIRDVFCKAIRR